MMNRNVRTASFCLLITLFILSSVRAANPRFAGVVNASDENAVKLVLQLDSPVQPNSFTLNDPARIVVDFKGVDSSVAPYEEPVADDLLTFIRVGRPATDTVRIVLELKHLMPYEIAPREGGPSLSVSVPRSIEPAKSGGEIAPGVNLKQNVEMADYGPLAYTVLDVDLNEKQLAVTAVMGEDRIGSREKLTSMVKRTGAIAGINGGYFVMENGKPIDLLVIDGKVLALPERFRGFFGIRRNGKPVFIQPSVEMTVSAGGARAWYVHRLNEPPQSGQIAVFTPEYGAATGTKPDRKEAAVSGGVITSFHNGNSPIPADGFVLSTDAAQSFLFDSLRIGDTLKKSVASYPDISDVAYGMTAGPMLIRGGITQKSLIEDFAVTSSIVSKRNPRTAVGLTKNNHLIFVVVEGRSARSAGMSLDELARLMRALGAVDAINLDGGGSSEIVVKDKIVNELSDGRERPLANAFLVQPRADAGKKK